MRMAFGFARTLDVSVCSAGETVIAG